MGAVSASTHIDILEHPGWAELRINRPDKRNALSGALVDELLATLDAMARSERRTVLLSAAGPIFCAGADLQDRGGPDGPSPTERLLAGLRETEIVIIAEVAAPVLGAGIALLSCCTAVVCSEDCWFALPEGRLGFFPAPMARYIQNALPPRVLMNFALGDFKLTATDAVSYGLVSCAAPATELRQRTLRIVERAVAEPGVFDMARQFWQGQIREGRSLTSLAAVGPSLSNKDRI